MLAYPSVFIRLTAGTIFTSVYELPCALQVSLNDYVHYPEGEQLSAVEGLSNSSP